MLQRKGILIIKHIGADRAVAVLDKIFVILPLCHLFTKIQLPHLAVAQNLHDIADAAIIKVKLPCLLIEHDPHDIFLLTLFM